MNNKITNYEGEPLIQGKWTTVVSTFFGGKAENELDKQGPLISVGREPPQNVTDNPLYTDKPVVLRYSKRTVKYSDVSDYFPDPWLTHISLPASDEVCTWKEDYPSMMDGIPSEIDVLLIEDYNTTGLVGDVTQCMPKYIGDNKYTKATLDNTYFWFLRSLSKSTDKPGRGGSWGLGKLAIPMASSARTFFTVTSRNETKDRFLSGQAILTLRNRFDTQYDPNMYFGTGEFYDEGKEHQWIPISDSDYIDNFCSDFGVSRNLEDSGTSFVIPFPVISDNDFNIGNLLICTVANYCIPILENKLVLEFSLSPDEEPIKVDSQKLIQLIEGKTGGFEVPWSKIRKTMNDGRNPNPAHTSPEILKELIRLNSDLNNPKYSIHLNAPKSGGKPNTTEQFSGIFPDKDSEELEKLKIAFNANESIVVTGDLRVNHKNKDEEMGNYSFVIRKSDDLESAEAHFYRDQISLPLVGDKKPIMPGISSLMRVEGLDNPLAEMLRQSEGPAHLKWESQSTKLKRLYNYGPTSIFFLRDIAHKFVKLLLSVNYDVESIWDEIFSSGKEILHTDPPEINRYLDIQEDISGGFIIKKLNAPNVPSLSGREYVIRVGYPKPARENPSKPPDPRAINIHEMSWNCSGAEVSFSEQAKNGEICVDRVRACINNEDFEIKLLGLNTEIKAQVISKEV